MVKDLFERKINDTLSRAEGKKPGSIEQSDYAKYLCILVSGYLEKSVSFKLIEYCNKRSNANVSRFTESKIKRVTNLKSEKIIELLRSFNNDWGDCFCKKLDDMKRDHINSLVSLRNSIAHGGDNSISLKSIKEIYETIKTVIDDIYETIEQK